MTIIITFFVIFISLLILGVPIGFGILFGGVGGFLVGNLNTALIAPALLAGLDSFPLVAIPAFIFAGDLMSHGGISSSIVDLVRGFLGRLRGSLGAVTVAVCMLFGAITGSSVATVSAVGGIMAPEMAKDGYDKNYITALLAAAGFLGTLIPPSVPGIMYALMSGESVTAVWMSTLVPGIVLGITYMVANYLMVGRKAEKNTEEFNLTEYFANIGRRTPKALVAFIMPLIIFGGVYGGVFTATEAGIVAVVYGIIAGWFIYPKFFKMKPGTSLYGITKGSAMSCVSICILIGMSTVVSRMVAMGGVTAQITEFLMGITDNPHVFLIIVNVLLIIVGMFLETNAGILLFCPILIPLAEAYGIDLVHFGAVLLLNLEIGLMTPPFAGNLFVACKITNCTIDKVLPKLLPFYVCAIITLIVVTYVPIVSTWLPGITG